MKVAVIMGSTSDLEIMSQAINVLEGFGVEVVKRVISAHRTPDLMCEFAKSAKAEGIGAIIAGAGGAAHVAGVVAGILHGSVVAYIGSIYGGMNLYNNGFAAGFVAIIMVPVIESFIKRYK